MSVGVHPPLQVPSPVLIPLHNIEVTISVRRFRHQPEARLPELLECAALQAVRGESASLVAVGTWVALQGVSVGGGVMRGVDLGKPSARVGVTSELT